MKGISVAVYCRVDSGGSLEMQQQALHIQKQQLEQYAQAQGLKITGYYQDAGYSGHDMRRPGLTQWLEDWKSGNFETVLVVKRTRLFRGSVWEEPKWPFKVISANSLNCFQHHEIKR